MLNLGLEPPTSGLQVCRLIDHATEFGTKLLFKITAANAKQKEKIMLPIPILKILIILETLLTVQKYHSLKL